MAQYVYTMNRVSKIVPPKREILKDISLSFFPGAKIGVLGLNGSGKSSLLNIMSGIDTDIQGEATPMPNIKIGYLCQEPLLDHKKNVRQNVEEGALEALEALKELEQIYVDYAEPDADFDKLAKRQEQLENIIELWDAHNLDNQLSIAGDALRLPPWDSDISKLSGGEKRRVALCKLLISKPDMILLDEPTNHLDAESVYWLEKFLEEFSGTVVAVTHDRYFLDNVAGWILELDRGHGIPYEGNYTNWLETKEARLNIEKKQEDARQRTIKNELEWVRQNPKGRHAKNKARLARFEEINSQEFQSRNETNEIFIPPGPRLGENVISFDGVTKSFGDQLLIDDLSLKIPKGSIVGIVGGNGSGKSTLFKMICGIENPDKGNISIGESVKLAFVDQSRENLDDNQSVWEAISDNHDTLKIGSYEISSRAYAGRFNFKGNDQQKKVGELSGGERGRLHLGITLKQGANVLLLDEPSNDLDIETLRALEEAIQNFPGCVLVISHDRWFLDRISTHILAYEGNSEVRFFEGNYSEYHADLKKRKGSDSEPKRVKYKRLKN
ncbi:MAG: energy-dependent translational throttle protein EttA [Porticoccus sp.]|nr:energy-dependent translational throttle protein EttA [Porticoccus sp.]